MFEILSTLLKYVLTIVIYFFIYGIIRLIYLDIQSMNNAGRRPEGKSTYLKLLNRRDSFNFKLEESYSLGLKTHIGRSMKNEIGILDPYLSSEHVRITLKDNRFFLEDMNSKNGTFVNEKRVTQEGVFLENGDKVQLGQLEFLFVNTAG